MDFANITNLILFTQNDPVHNNIVHTNGNIKSVEWTDGSRIEYSYDIYNRLIKAQFIHGETVEIYEYCYHRNGDVYCKNNGIIRKVIK